MRRFSCKEQKRDLPERLFCLFCSFYRCVNWGPDKERKCQGGLVAVDSVCDPGWSLFFPVSVWSRFILRPTCEWGRNDSLSYHWGNWVSERARAVPASPQPKGVGDRARTRTRTQFSACPNWSLPAHEAGPPQTHHRAPQEPCQLQQSLTSGTSYYIEKPNFILKDALSS